jgi:hypothetical protein
VKITENGVEIVPPAGHPVSQQPDDASQQQHGRLDQRGHHRSQQQQQQQQPSSSPQARGGACSPGSAAAAAEAAEAEVAAQQRGDAAATHCCPPHGAKAVCGKRSTMEDAYAVCPNLFEVALLASCDAPADKLPHRIAGQMCSSSWGPAAGHTQGAASTVSSCSPPHLSDLDQSPSGSTASSEDGAPESLHFFGVYDGHGGVQAAQHCAKRLHHHLCSALSALCGGGGVAAGECCLGGEEADSSSAGDELVGGMSGLGISQPWQLQPAFSEVAPAGAAGAGFWSPAAPGPRAPAGEAAAAAAAAANAAAAAQRSRLEAALHSAFISTDQEFSEECSSAALVGSTAVVALVGRTHVWVANCGERPRGPLRRSAACSLGREAGAAGGLGRGGGGTAADAPPLRPCTPLRPLHAADPLTPCCAAARAAGDSRAVLSRGGCAIQLTDDHKPEREDEAVRPARTHCTAPRCASRQSLIPEPRGAGQATAALWGRRPAARLACSGTGPTRRPPPCAPSGACGEGGRPGAVLQRASRHGRAGHEPRHRRPLPAPLRHRRARGGRRRAAAAASPPPAPRQWPCAAPSLLLLHARACGAGPG